MRPFNEVDQSVPAPEFGAGLSFRCTFADELALEKWADLKLLSVRQQYAGTIVAAISNWDWIAEVLASARTEELFDIIGLLLKKEDGERADLDLSKILFSRNAAAIKVQTSIVACRDGMTIKEIQDKLEEDRAKAGQQPPLESQVEVSSLKSTTSESEPDLAPLKSTD